MLTLLSLAPVQVATKALFDSMKRAQGGGTQMLKVCAVFLSVLKYGSSLPEMAVPFLVSQLRS